MEPKFSVKLSKIIKDVGLDVAYMPGDPEKIEIFSSKNISSLVISILFEIFNSLSIISYK